MFPALPGSTWKGLVQACQVAVVDDDGCCLAPPETQAVQPRFSSAVQSIISVHCQAPEPNHSSNHAQISFIVP